MAITSRKVAQLIAGLDERVQLAEELRDKLSGQLQRAQYNYEALADARQAVAAILVAMDEPEEPPF